MIESVNLINAETDIQKLNNYNNKEIVQETELGYQLQILKIQ